MKILIDGDGCPVVEQTVQAAKTHHLECLIFCDTAHLFRSDYAKVIIVSKGADSADFALVGSVDPGDIVITQDYGLAAMCLAKGASVLRQDGFIYTDDNIDGLLLTRHIAKKIRRSGGRLKGPSARTKEEDAAFSAALQRILEEKS